MSRTPYAKVDIMLSSVNDADVEIRLMSESHFIVDAPNLALRHLVDETVPAILSTLIRTERATESKRTPTKPFINPLIWRNWQFKVKHEYWNGANSLVFCSLSAIAETRVEWTSRLIWT